MFYGWSLSLVFVTFSLLIWPLWCCIFLLFQHCVMWTCTRYIYTFICVVNKQYKCDYVVIKLTMKTILYCIIIHTCNSIWYKILNLFLSFLIVIYCILATRQANGSCLQQLRKSFRCSQAIIGNSWQIRVRALVFNATINNISVISVAVTFIGRGNCSIWKKPQTCRQSPTNFIT